jgi:hypothetical protein
MRLEKRERRFLLFGLILALWAGQAQAQTVSFNFSATSSVWPGWVNVAGDPSHAVQTATANGVTISSVATANWSPWSGIAAGTGTGWYPGTYFPARVMSNNWFTYNGTSRSLALYNMLTPQIELSGLNPDSTYILRISGSDAGSFIASPTQYTVIGKTNYGTQNLNVHNNAANGVVFQGVAPDLSGMIRLYVSATTGTDIAAISGIQVYPGYYGVGSPGVLINAPGNGANLAEGDNILIKAIALEVADTIAKVQFYADTTKIGEVDTVPYNFTWVDPDPGVYTITAKATDNQGTVNSASVSVDVVALNSYWSTTGNVGNNADSTFIGNVDSVRLDFRTKNIQRMSITATGNVGIGTISPTAQLHVSGAIRMAGLVNDSTDVYARALVIDTNGNLAFRSAADFGLVAGGGVGLTRTGILALGDSVAGSGSHNFMVNRYQNLNGYSYSVGGSVNDPVNAAIFRWYNNGDLVSGTTMDRSVNTQYGTGIRYYNKIGILELGASDELDTTRSPIVAAGRQGSGVHLNSEIASTGDPKTINTVFLSFAANVDTSVVLRNSLLAVQDLGITKPGSMTNSLHVGGSALVTAPVYNSIVGGFEGIDVFTNASLVTGGNLQVDTTEYSTITGFENSFGGLGQLVVGAYNKNKTPFGSAFGVSNVGFTTQTYTHTLGMTSSGISGYPLLTIGNSAFVTDSIGSNAVTTLFNGRTQINTSGDSIALSQTAATPKAALEVVSTNSGVLLPKLNTSQLNGIITQDLQNGLLLYNSDSATFQYYNGTGWSTFGAPAGGNMAGWGYLGNAGTNSDSNFIGTVDSTQLVFRTGNAPQMTIFANGGVGIGTSVLPAGDAVLAVDGIIYSSKIVVTLTGWPDYVFGKGYRLPAIYSVGRYIKQHGHLPGLPDAGEVATGGLDVGQMQKSLLEKTEELTLYLIEMHRQAQAREKEIEELRVMNGSLKKHQEELDQLKVQITQLAIRK